MFEFLKDDEPATGAEQRFHARIPLFVKDGRPNPRLRHHTHWLIHNCIVHPLLGVIPNQRTAELHSLSSNWLNHRAGDWKQRLRGGAYQTFSPIPQIPEGKRGWWLLHNVVAHMAIGLCPTKPAFDLHDWSAEKMDVPGWL